MCKTLKNVIFENNSDCRKQSKEKKMYKNIGYDNNLCLAFK